MIFVLVWIDFIFFLAKLRILQNKTHSVIPEAFHISNDVNIPDFSSIGMLMKWIYASNLI
jgi:hypothetical protein